VLKAGEVRRSSFKDKQGGYIFPLEEGRQDQSLDLCFRLVFATEGEEQLADFLALREATTGNGNWKTRTPIELYPRLLFHRTKTIFTD
jgi:hypothetical protein